MSEAEQNLQSAIPSVDRLLRAAPVLALVEAYGRPAARDAVRAVLAELREELAVGGAAPDEAGIAARVEASLVELMRPTLKSVFNLTGTVLHTNLGRAPMAEVAAEAAAAAALGALNIEFDLARGKRGERDSHLEARICRLTGAEAATVVNNNAAAVLLVLNSLANRKQVPVSRGELIEIGGAFRMPDVMARAGCKLVEIGTTNRTHLKDYAAAIGHKTALVMKVHTSNYKVEGFTAEVPEAELAALAHEHGLPFVVDIGSGMLVALADFGLPHEATPRETLAAGADLVTFSGDKLLGGPQAGIIAGRKDLVAKLNRNPLKRALRCGKMTIAALGATLALYEDPERLAERLPALRLLSRDAGEIEALAKRLAPKLAAALAGRAEVEVVACMSQIGSGALPVDALPSFAVSLAPTGKKSAGAALNRLAAAFRGLPRPVIGRIQDDRLSFDLRCLEDEAGFLDQLSQLAVK